MLRAAAVRVRKRVAAMVDVRVVEEIVDEAWAAALMAMDA